VRNSIRVASAPLLAGVAILGLACSDGGRQGRVIVLGLDGVDPGVVHALVAEGRLPNLARCLESGASGTLRGDEPLLSPVLWTTMATGRPPDVHGIGGFTTRGGTGVEDQPVASTTRRVPALWNIASDAGLEVGVVGWWATWPPEHVHGAVVSDRTCYHFLLGGARSDDLSDTVWPPAAAHWIGRLVQRPDELTAGELERVAEVGSDADHGEFTFADDVQHLRWALATANSYSRIGLELWRREAPDLLMVYIEAPDTVSHLFGHLYRAPPLAGALAEQQRRFGATVERVYELADGIVGEFMEAMDADTTLLVISDHGFRLGQPGPRDAVPGGDPRRISERSHAPEGLLVLAGRGVDPDAVVEGARQLDVTPTALALLGLPAARDMPGRVLVEALDAVEVPARIASYGERRAHDAAAGGGGETGDLDRAVVEHLRSLGYLDDDGQDVVDRGRADMLLNAGRDEEAARAYQRLLEKAPDDPELHLNLGVALARLGRLDEASSRFEKTLALDPTNARAQLNLGLIHERRGEMDAAVAALRRAVQYDAGLEAARRALHRLTGSSMPVDLDSDEERAAARLAVEAGAAQSRGDLAGAASLLERATRTAPDLAPVWEQRATVAYLRGRLDEAQACLERSLELDPGNAMARKNLDAVNRKLGSSTPLSAPAGPRSTPSPDRPR